MLKKIQVSTIDGYGILFATDDENTAKKMIESGEAVLYVCEDVENVPFIDGVKYITDDIDGCDESYLRMAYARQKNLPFQVAETERTVIREITVSDLPELYQVYDDDEVRRYMEPLYEYDKEKIYTENYIANMYGVCGYGLWLVFDKATGKMAGRAGISVRQIDGDYYNELGYVIRKEFRRKGYAYEVCKAILEYASENLHIYNPVIVTETANKASKGLADKLGFRELGTTVMNEKEYAIYQI